MGYKTIMVHVELEQSNDGLSAVASDLAARFEASVIGIACCQPFPIMWEQEGYISAEVIQADRDQIEKQMQAAKTRFQQEVKARPGITEWRYTVTPGSLADYVAAEARAADLVITGPDIGGSIFDHTRRVPVADLVFRAGRPVLIVPKGCSQLDLGKAAVGWKETPECRRAVAGALPMLKLAKQVTVLAIAGDESLPEAAENVNDVVKWLKRHGIGATAQTAHSKGPDAKAFAGLVGEMGAGLVVAGAYGHSRLREWALGGVTGDYLIAPDRPVLLSH